ncbi:MAG: hypothetical protein ABGZ53_10455 [Fuerstiella sp.]
MATLPTFVVLPLAGSADRSTDSAASQFTTLGLENLIRVSGRVLCGGEPRGKTAFETLKKLRVNTIVSVDGAAPQVDLAKQMGIRYIHIPVGYDGVSQEAGQSLTRVVQETKGAIYIHCHHGRHRGPAAAAIACRIEGTADADRALQIMVIAGTSEDYVGLWRDVAMFAVPYDSVQLPRLVEVAPLESMAAVMARISRRFDKLKTSCAATPPSSPDHSRRIAAQDALLLHESLREAARHLPSGCDQEFRTWLAKSDDAAKDVYDSLQSGSADSAVRHFKVLQQLCTQCHKAYRN